MPPRRRSSGRTPSPQSSEALGRAEAASDAKPDGRNLGSNGIEIEKNDDTSSEKGKNKEHDELLQISELHDPAIRYGEIVWAKLRGYPYWPGCICNPEDLTGKVQQMAKGKNRTHYVVYFYFSDNFGLVPLSDCVIWESTSKNYREGVPSSKFKNQKQKDELAEAIRLAENAREDDSTKKETEKIPASIKDDSIKSQMIIEGSIVSAPVETSTKKQERPTKKMKSSRESVTEPKVTKNGESSAGIKRRKSCASAVEENEIPESGHSEKVSSKKKEVQPRTEEVKEKSEQTMKKQHNADVHMSEEQIVIKLTKKLSRLESKKPDRSIQIMKEMMKIRFTLDLAQKSGLPQVVSALRKSEVEEIAIMARTLRKSIMSQLGLSSAKSDKTARSSTPISVAHTAEDSNSTCDAQPQASPRSELVISDENSLKADDCFSEKMSMVINQELFAKPFDSRRQLLVNLLQKSLGVAQQKRKEEDICYTIEQAVFDRFHSTEYDYTHQMRLIIFGLKQCSDYRTRVLNGGVHVFQLARATNKDFGISEDPNDVE